MKIFYTIFIVYSSIFAVNCAGQHYCSETNLHPIYLRFGIHSIAFHVTGCFSASYVKSTCDISFHNSESTIASIPYQTRQKRQLFGFPTRSIFESLVFGGLQDRSGLTVPFTISQYVNSLPRNSYLYAIMTDARSAAYYEGIPYCEVHLIAPLRKHLASLGGREDIWYYQRPDGTRIIIAFNKECPYFCLTD
ncbi:uncharacterized protein [Chironomus tepperi]|uniref:uncharacterized protein n=1 Tax=Chironomus tepperi TaxID=113505 RepID=UPI00391F9CBC